MELFQSSMINVFVKNEAKQIYSIVITQEKDNYLPYRINHLLKGYYSDSAFHVGDEVLFNVNLQQVREISKNNTVFTTIFTKAGLIK